MAKTRHPKFDWDWEAIKTWVSCFDKDYGTARGCKNSTTKQDALEKIATLTAIIAVRKLYLNRRCDYVLPGSIARGSQVAEAGHRIQVRNLSVSLGICTAKLPTLP